MTIDALRETLLTHREDTYAAFQGALIPNLDAADLIGVRTPILRKLAKELVRSGDATLFLDDLPHRYHEENVLHAFVIAEERDFSRCMEAVSRFLPYVNNWAVCDGLSPKIFAKYKAELLAQCRIWLRSDHVYTVRFALVMLLKHFTEAPHCAEALSLAMSAKGGYYVDTAVAWLFAEAIAKCPDVAVRYFEHGLLRTEVHNKAIQKAVESYRVPSETKAYLKTLKQKKS